MTRLVRKVDYPFEDFNKEGPQTACFTCDPSRLELGYCKNSSVVLGILVASKMLQSSWITVADIFKVPTKFNGAVATKRRPLLAHEAHTTKNSSYFLCSIPK